MPALRIWWVIASSESQGLIQVKCAIYFFICFNFRMLLICRYYWYKLYFLYAYNIYLFRFAEWIQNKINSLINVWNQYVWPARKRYADVACKQCQNPLHVLFFCIGAYIFVLLLLICISLRVQNHKNIYKLRIFHSFVEVLKYLCFLRLIKLVSLIFKRISEVCPVLILFPSALINI